MSAWPPTLDALHVTHDCGVAVFHALEFAVVDGFRPLQLDLYLPPRNHPRADSAPAIVYLHGGGWAVGTRRRFGRAFRGWDVSPLIQLAEAGFVVASVDYRLSGEATFPAPLHDAKAAVRWLRAHAAELRVDGNRVLAWGESAGGHLALLLGMTAARDDLAGSVGDALDQRGDVCGVVAWYPPTDFTSLSAQRHPSSETDYDSADAPESRLLGGPISSLPDLAAAASPLTYVHSGAPPVQIHHGNADLMVPHAQSATFAAALEELEVEVELVTLLGTDHFWIGAPDIAAIFQASLAFAIAKTL
jgi:acetyl esterase/lipase